MLGRLNIAKSCSRPRPLKPMEPVPMPPSGNEIWSRYLSLYTRWGPDVNKSSREYLDCVMMTCSSRASKKSNQLIYDMEHERTANGRMSSLHELFLLRIKKKTNTLRTCA